MIKFRSGEFYFFIFNNIVGEVCNRCGHINKDVKDLKVREWECPNCTNINDRDINASINIMWEGMKAYMGCSRNIELQVK